MHRSIDNLTIQRRGEGGGEGRRRSMCVGEGGGRRRCVCVSRKGGGGYCRKRWIWRALRYSFFFLLFFNMIVGISSKCALYVRCFNRSCNKHLVQFCRGNIYFFVTSSYALSIYYFMVSLSKMTQSSFTRKGEHQRSSNPRNSP